MGGPEWKQTGRGRGAVCGPGGPGAATAHLDFKAAFQLQRPGRLVKPTLVCSFTHSASVPHEGPLGLNGLDFTGVAGPASSCRLPVQYTPA